MLERDRQKNGDLIKRNFHEIYFKLFVSTLGGRISFSCEHIFYIHKIWFLNIGSNLIKLSKLRQVKKIKKKNTQGG